MDNRLIFLYPYISEVMTEKAKRATYWMVVQAK